MLRVICFGLIGFLFGCSSSPSTRVVRNIYYDENNKLMVEVCNPAVRGWPGYSISMINCEASEVRK